MSDHDRVNPDEPRRPSSWDNLDGALDTAFRGLRALWHEGNRRQLALRNRSGATLFRLPLMLALLIGLFLLWKAAPLLILGVILVFALRASFVVLGPPANHG